MRPSTTLPSPPQPERLAESRPSLNPAGLISLILLTGILFLGPSLLGAVRPWVELPILLAAALLLLIQSFRLVAPAPIGAMRQVDAIDLAVLLFTAYAIVRGLASPSWYISSFEVFSVIGYAIVFFYCRYGIGRRSYGVGLIVLLVVLGLGEVIFGYLYYLHSNPGDPQSAWYPFGRNDQMQLHWAPRWVGTYGCPDHYVSLLVMALGGALAVGSFSRFNWPVRIVFFYLAALLLVGIVYSQSRGGWLSLVGGMTAFTYFGLRYRRLPWWIPLGGALVVAAIFAALFYFSHVVKGRVHQVISIVETGNTSHYIRVELDRDALRIAHEHPFFGTGPATYNFEDPRYQGPYLRTRAAFTHDDYLNCLADYGLVGFALAIFFVSAVSIALLTQIRENSRWTERVVVATALAAWSALLVHSLLDFNLHIPANATLLFALTGMALYRRPGEDAPHHWTTVSLLKAGPWLGWGLAGFAVIYFAVVARAALSDFPYEDAADNSDITPTAQTIQELQQSLTFDSGNAAALTLLGDMHRFRTIRATTDEDRAVEGQAALDAYQKALKADPLDVSIYARMGVIYDLLERYPEAYLCYQNAIEAEPYDGQFWMVLGHHFMDYGRLDKAAESFEAAAACPVGNEGAADAASRLSGILNLGPIIPPQHPVKPEPLKTQSVAPFLPPEPTQAPDTNGAPAPTDGPISTVPEPPPQMAPPASPAPSDQPAPPELPAVPAPAHEEPPTQP